MNIQQLFHNNDKKTNLEIFSCGEANDSGTSLYTDSRLRDGCFSMEKCRPRRLSGVAGTSTICMEWVFLRRRGVSARRGFICML